MTRNERPEINRPFLLVFNLSNSCPLCKSDACNFFSEDKKRIYLKCSQCSLVFVPEKFHLSSDKEKCEYDKHENSPDDLGYRRFLSRLAEPLSHYLEPDACGLDFGCGPGPALPAMMGEKGFSLAVYDQFYQTDRSVLQKDYDFVTATEVLEHLRDPQLILNKIWSLIVDRGYLGVMTKLVKNAEAFSRWHYKNDPTHIIFFSIETFEYLSVLFKAEIVFQKDDVTIFRKLPRL